MHDAVPFSLTKIFGEKPLSPQSPTRGQLMQHSRNVEFGDINNSKQAASGKTVVFTHPAKTQNARILFCSSRVGRHPYVSPRIEHDPRRFRTQPARNYQPGSSARRQRATCRAHHIQKKKMAHFRRVYLSTILYCKGGTVTEISSAAFESIVTSVQRSRGHLNAD